MTKVWLIWVQDGDATWLEAAWTDDMTTENREGYDTEVARVRKMCSGDDDYTMRIQAVLVPGEHALFDIPTVTARPA